MADIGVRERVRGCMARAFEMGLADLPECAEVDSVEPWDSLGHLALFEALQEEFAGRLPFSAFREMLSEDEVVAYLERH